MEPVNSNISLTERKIVVGDIVLKEGDVVTLNGTKGFAYLGEQPMINATENPRFQQYMGLVDKFRTMGVRTNADTPEDAVLAREFGAEGIGLFRTEHMFYGKDATTPLFLLRKMILASSVDERKAALEQLFPFIKKDSRRHLRQ